VPQGKLLKFPETRLSPFLRLHPSASLRVEDSGQTPLTLDGYLTSPGMRAQEQRYSPKLRKLQTSWIDLMGKGWYGIFGYAREISLEDWEVAHIRMEERIFPGAIVYSSKKVAKERHLFQ